jgi:hypothetical protein
MDDDVFKGLFIPKHLQDLPSKMLEKTLVGLEN